MTSEKNILSGSPSNRLVKDVRRHLWRYLRCRPEKESKNWLDAWKWADACRYERVKFTSTLAKKWPMPSEIATQYLMLVLAEMKQFHALRLPYAAERCVPPMSTLVADTITGLPLASKSNVVALLDHSEDI